MSSRLWCVVALALTTSAPLSVEAGVGDPTDFEVVVFEPKELRLAVEEQEIFTLALAKESLELILERVDLRSPEFTFRRSGQPGTAPSGRTETYQGRVRGQPDSTVCLSIVGEQVRGHIRDARGWLFVEPLPADRATGRHEVMVYNEGDIDPFLHEGCGTTAAEHIQAEFPDLAPDTADGTAENTELRVIELAIDVDADYEAIYGAGTTAQIESIINEVDAIYQRDLNLTIEIVTINIWDDEPDPYTATGANALLVEFRDHWNANFTTVNRDAVHLFTGKNLDGSTIGIAYTGAMCLNSFHYGLSQDYTSSLMPLLVAHEIGHNLGASHDGTGTSPRYVMYPSLGATNLDEFSPGSITDVASFVASVSCLAVAESGGGGSSSGGGSGGGGGGGGGGPVDPWTLLLVVAGLIAYRVQRCQSAA